MNAIKKVTVDTYVDVETGEVLDTRSYEEENSKRSPFSDWVQLNLEHTAILMELTLKSPKARAILDFLIDQMDKQNAVVVSINTISEMLNVSRQTVSKSIKLLQDKSLIYVVKVGNQNAYLINPDLTWKSYGKNVKYAKFPAEIVISEAEQINFNKRPEKINIVKK